MIICHTVRGGGYIKPNVSLSIDTEEVHYNYPRWDTNNKPFVDLGLPSGTLWATMNVGADKPSDYGLYFQWGDTQGYTADQVGDGEGQKQFAQNWSDYKWHLSGDSYDNVAFTKYTTQGATLELEDDAAHVHMGGDWHMPTPKQIQELLDNTTTARTTSDGISGMTFTSKKDTSKSIFIPTPGTATNSYISYYGNYCYVWSSMLIINNLNPNFISTAKCLRIYKNTFYSGINIGDEIRNVGCSIRGVLG